MTDGIFRQLFASDGTLQVYELSDVPLDTRPREIGLVLAPWFPEKEQQRTPYGQLIHTLVVAVQRDDGSYERLDLDAPLSEQGVVNRDHLNVYVESRAGGASLDFLLGMLGGSALIPFVQAISTKAGEDAYAKVRQLLSRRSRDQLPPDADIVVGHRRSKLVLRVSTEALWPPPPEEPGPPEDEDNDPDAPWQVITWEPETGNWRRTRADAPPPGTVFVRRRWWRRRSPDA